MMKRSILLLGALGVTLGANAQLQQTSVVQKAVRDAGTNMPLPAQSYRATRGQSMDQQKTAGNHTRWYNYVDQLAKANTAITASNSNYDNYPYMWFDASAKGMYTAANGVDQEADSIKLCSIGSVLHPFWAGYNGTGDWPKGTMITKSTNAYNVDSIVFYGVYGRPNSRTSVVDTLRISYTYGNGSGTSNLPIYYYLGMMANYGSDTVFSVIPSFDLTRHIMYKPSASTGPAIQTQDVLLHSTDTGFVVAGIAANMSVPAGNVVAATITFKSGDPSFVPGDTVFRGGTLNPTEPFKYGMFRPQIFVERLLTGTTPNFPTYTKGNYNAGEFEQLPERDPQSSATYSPNWAWTTNNGTGASVYQFPYVDWKLSCATCNIGVGETDSTNPGGVGNIANTVNIGQPYPNPATNSVSLPIQMKQQAVVTAKLSNMMGQVVATQSLGKLAAHQMANVTFSTESLANGIYLITVDADGNQETKRVAVTR